MDYVKIVLRINSWCTGLFPKEYRNKFKDESQDVFRSLAEDSFRNGGKNGLIKFFLKEMRDFPRNLVQEYLVLFGRNLSKIRMSQTDIAPIRQGALGFGIGFCFLIIFRWLLDSNTNLISENFVLKSLRETLFFSVIAILGWAFLSQTIQSAKKKNFLLVLSFVFGALGGFTSTVFVHITTHYLARYFGEMPFLRLLIQTVSAMIYGTSIGAVFGLHDKWKHRFLRMALIGCLSFGCGYLVFELSFHLICTLLLSNLWRSEYWFIPLALTSAIHGIFGGALLGWFMRVEDHTKPTIQSLNAINV